MAWLSGGKDVAGEQRRDRRRSMVVLMEPGAAVATARRLAEEVLAPRAASVDAERRWPAEGMAALLSELGGLVVPEEFGGMGHGLSAVARVGEATGRACASTSICFGMHLVACAVIAARATDHQRRHYLEPIAAGRHLTTLALSEPGTGGEFWLPRTRMETRGSRLSLTGEKSFVTNGEHADSYVVSTVAAGEDALPGQFSCVLLDGDGPGVSWGPPWTGMGMCGNNSRSLRLDEVSLSRTRLLGEEGAEIWYVFNVVAPYFLVAMAGTYLGVAAAALEEARGHLLRRRHAHSGNALAAQPLVQHRLGTMWARVERTRRLIYRAAAEADAGGPEGLLGLCSAKAEVAEAAESVINDALTLTGGIGYSLNSPLQRHLRDARAAHVMAPLTDTLRVWTGRALLDQPLLGE
ncbi:acyl-CoA dehydrogenase family protein [Streptomyces sp. ST2-7A]|uniref:acyl-CoA dehydrogenase family protein n=1 Tax=Streptomyces sp. ST2-7A TaxID=2907214 RepID=UPI001F3CE406|nr:acyl-CoA dehydrogenase family protein [Streptomyces sp. ST2-7A]MCE7080373.1 acyl-CoA/acyl-ACP dehydrogenase [Streptomyces sp. ST2-7A]